MIRVDRTGPETVEIQPTDPTNPRKITAEVFDRGSGIQTGVIQLRPTGGTWSDLPTNLNESGTQLTAELNDLELPNGGYQLRAAATDGVNNSRTGSPALIQLPVRAPSRVNLAPRSRTRNAVAGKVVDQEGKPLAGATVAVLTKARTEKNWRQATTIRSGKDGRFRYRVPSGPTRTIRFAYTGTNTVRPAHASRAVRVPARTTIQASRRHASLGQTIVFSGRLRGRPIPKGGKVLELQAYDGGRWRSFPQVVTSTKSGRWMTKLRFERTRGIYTYKIRARVFRDASYPYETGVSRTVKVTVRGR